MPHHLQNVLFLQIRNYLPHKMRGNENLIITKSGLWRLINKITEKPF